jgi:hypothetical protein
VGSEQGCGLNEGAMPKRGLYDNTRSLRSHEGRMIDICAQQAL